MCYMQHFLMSSTSFAHRAFRHSTRKRHLSTRDVEKERKKLLLALKYRTAMNHSISQTKSTYISTIGAGGVSSRKHAIAHVVVDLSCKKKLKKISPLTNITQTETVDESNLLAGAHEGLVHAVRVLRAGLHVGETVFVRKSLSLRAVYLSPASKANDTWKERR